MAAVGGGGSGGQWLTFHHLNVLRGESSFLEIGRFQLMAWKNSCDLIPLALSTEARLSGRHSSSWLMKLPSGWGLG